MNNRGKVFTAIFILFLAYAIYYLFTNLDFLNKGNPGRCQDIKESKKRGVFMLKYKSKNNPTIINDSLHLFVNESWVERSWAFGYRTEETQIDSFYNFNINIKTKDNEKFILLLKDKKIKFTGNDNYYPLHYWNGTLKARCFQRKTPVTLNLSKSEKFDVLIRKGANWEFLNSIELILDASDLDNMKFNFSE